MACAATIAGSTLDYAALDVDYLYDVAKALIQQLKHTGRVQWAFTESQVLVSNYLANQDVASGFNKSGNTWRFKGDKLKRIKELVHLARADGSEVKIFPVIAL